MGCKNILRVVRLCPPYYHKYEPFPPVLASHLVHMIATSSKFSVSVSLTLANSNAMPYQFRNCVRARKAEPTTSSSVALSSTLKYSESAIYEGSLEYKEEEADKSTLRKG
jgi:hypothetical protein